MGGVESTCIFGLDLNVPLTINGDAEQTDPAVKEALNADLCMVDVLPVLDVEEALNEDHPERHDNTENVQCGLDVENNDKFVRHSGHRVDVDDGVDCSYGGRVYLCRYYFFFICTVLLLVQILLCQ
ncbi:unnamed protein product [Linum trigynum]|uniref:Uncharacterized protein n=1 Tax=Linum trigynum TaxID=586398 RepID=A0AAV2D4D1_9ROSI